MPRAPTFLLLSDPLSITVAEGAIVEGSLGTQIAAAQVISYKDQRIVIMEILLRVSQSSNYHQ